MVPEETSKKIIGRAEKASFPELGFTDVPTRIDTGAKTSSIWASDILFVNGLLHAKLFGAGNDLYTGEVITFSDFDKIAVSTSTGEIQERYKVRLLVKLKGKKIRAWFTLADRSTQVYPVLIGRNVLMGKFVVDVKKGKTLKEAEKRRTESLQKRLEKQEGEDA